jgi:hypothetical protein
MNLVSPLQPLGVPKSYRSPSRFFQATSSALKALLDAQRGVVLGHLADMSSIGIPTLANAPNACVIFPRNATAAAQGTTLARGGSPYARRFVTLAEINGRLPAGAATGGLY